LCFKRAFSCPSKSVVFFLSFQQAKVKPPPQNSKIFEKREQQQKDFSNSKRIIIIMAPLKTLSETAKNYKDALSELKMNSKPIITSLTMLATEIAKTDDDEAKTEARNIANVIETRVVEKARDSRVALATLYVLDSIAKNCRDPYASVFAPHVAGVFLTLFAQTDEKTKQSMKKLLGTWETQNVFPREVLARIQTDVDLSGNARVPPPPPPIVHQHQQRVVPPPPPILMMGQPAAAPLQQQQQQFLGQPAPLVAGGMPVVLPDLSGLLNTLKAQQAQSVGGGSHQSLQGIVAAAPQHHHHRPVTPDFANEDFDFLDAEESLKKFKRDPKSMNKRREYLVNALYDDLPFKCAQTGRRFASKESLDQHMDWLHAKRRRKKSGRACRGWHVSAKEWIKGTIKMGEVDPEFDAFAAGEKKKKENAVGIVIDENLDLNDLPSVLAIESQKKCALSGEPFETFWNEKAQEWHYGKAVKLKRAIGSKKVKAGEIALISAIPKEELEPELIEAIAKAQPRNASTKGAVLRESKRAKK